MWRGPRRNPVVPVTKSCACTRSAVNNRLPLSSRHQHCGPPRRSAGRVEARELQPTLQATAACSCRLLVVSDKTRASLCGGCAAFTRLQVGSQPAQGHTGAGTIRTCDIVAGVTNGRLLGRYCQGFNLRRRYFAMQTLVRNKVCCATYWSLCPLPQAQCMTAGSYLAQGSSCVTASAH